MDQGSRKVIDKKITIIDGEAVVKAFQLIKEGGFGGLAASAFEIDAYDVASLPGFVQAPLIAAG